MKKSKLNLSLPVTFIKENNSFIAYTPALDISTVGDSLEEAKARFEQLVEIFFEEIIEKGTLDQVLSNLGWKKEAKKYTPPVIVSHIVENFSIPSSVN